MHGSESISIAKPKQLVWQTITDIAHCETWMSKIKAIDILERPEDSFICLTWKQTLDF